MREHSTPPGSEIAAVVTRSHPAQTARLRDLSDTTRPSRSAGSWPRAADLRRRVKSAAIWGRLAIKSMQRHGRPWLLLSIQSRLALPVRTEPRREGAQQCCLAKPSKSPCRCTRPVLLALRS